MKTKEESTKAKIAMTAFIVFLMALAIVASYPL